MFHIVLIDMLKWMMDRFRQSNCVFGVALTETDMLFEVDVGQIEADSIQTS